MSQEISQEDALHEAYKRGILPTDMKEAYEEAQSRGLIGGKPAPIELPPVINQFSEYYGALDLEHPATAAAAHGIVRRAPRGGRASTPRRRRRSATWRRGCGALLPR